MDDFCHTIAMSRFTLTHRRVNHLLTVVAVGLGLYIMIYPFLPQVVWKIAHPNNTVEATPATTPASQTNSDVPDGDLLLIPRLGMRETIHSGKSISELRKGTWLLPHSSQPDQQSNTVIVGHRFTYGGRGVFYHLDKVQVNDEITVYWEGTEYSYNVSSTKTVPATEVSVEQPTDSAKLTLYTCTPLLTAKDRLVVTADLIGTYP
jgi:sortase A